MEGTRILEFVCAICKKSRKEKEDLIKKANFICKYCRANESRRKTFLERYGVSNPLKSKEVQAKIKATNLERFGVENPLQSKTIQARRKQTLENRYNVDNPAHIESSQKKKKQTYLEKYGTDHPWKNEKVKERRKQTWLQNLGTETPFQSDTVQAKVKQTVLEKYGVNNVRKSEIVKDKIKQTMIDRFGVENVSQSEETKKKKKQTSLLHFGTEHPAQSEVVKEREKQVWLKKYGVDHPWKSKIVQEKRKQTNLEKYGTEYPTRLDSIQEKAKQTSLDRYGVEYYNQSEEASKNHKSLYKYDNETFDSKPELAFYIYCKDLGKDIKRNRRPIRYVNSVDNSEHSYFPDFEVDGQLFEIKGDLFLKDDGTWKNPYNSDNDAFYENKHQAALANNVQILYSSDYQKYLDYVEEKYTKDYLDLFKSSLPFPYPNADFKLKGDLNLIQYFHKSIYSATKLNKPSPLQAWQDKELVRKVALNRLKYVKRCKPSDIRQGFSVTRLAPRISVFRPKFAEYLIEKYLKNFSLIVDPFSGFSGRLLGAFRQEKRYRGFDIHPDHVRESNELISYLKAENQVTVQQEDLLNAPVKTFDKDVCLFACPPYGGKEHWNRSNDEVEKSCDEWIDICLKKYQNCGAYLFVVDQTERYSQYIVEHFAPKNGLFKKMNELVILI